MKVVHAGHAVQRELRERDDREHDQRAQRHQRHELDHAPQHAAGALYPPYIVHAGLDAIDSSHQRPQQQHQTHHAHQPAADALGKLHQPASTSSGPAVTDRPEEFQQEGLQVALRAKGLEDGECQRNQRDQSQQRDVDQAGGAQRQFAVEQVADDGVRVAQCAQQAR